MNKPGGIPSPRDESDKYASDATSGYFRSIKFERDRAIHLLRDLTAMVRQLIFDGHWKYEPEPYKEAVEWLGGPTHFPLDSNDSAVMSARTSSKQEDVARVLARRCWGSERHWPEWMGEAKVALEVATASDTRVSVDALVAQNGLAEHALNAALDFINEEYRDAQAAALDGDPISREARPVRDKIVAALKELP